MKMSLDLNIERTPFYVITDTFMGARKYKF